MANNKSSDHSSVVKTISIKPKAEDKQAISFNVPPEAEAENTDNMSKPPTHVRNQTHFNITKHPKAEGEGNKSNKVAPETTNPRSPSHSRKKTIHIKPLANQGSAPENFFLDPSVFTEGKAFVGQESNLFSQEATALRNELIQILENIYSQENWEFLEAIHKINSQRNLSQADLETKLKEIEKTYIVDKAPKQINIKGETSKKILDSNPKKVSAYKDAIKEIFSLIRSNINIKTETKPATNINTDTKPAIGTKFRRATFFQKVTLAQLDRITPKVREILDLAADFNNLIQAQTEKPGVLQKYFQTNRDTILFIACQTACKNTQKDLRDLVKSPIKSVDEFETKLADILSNIMEKLNEGFKQIQKFEIKHKKDNIKSDAIGTIINEVNSSIKKLDLPNIKPDTKSVKKDSVSSSSENLIENSEKEESASFLHRRHR